MPLLPLDPLLGVRVCRRACMLVSVGVNVGSE